MPLKWSPKLHSVQTLPFEEYVGPNFDVPGSPVEVFKHFLTDDICRMIVQQSNLFVQQVLGEEKYEQWDKISVEELRAYLGFQIMMGVVRLPGIAHYWR